MRKSQLFHEKSGENEENRPPRGFREGRLQGFAAARGLKIREITPPRSGEGLLHIFSVVSC